MADVICLNGEFINSDEPVFQASNRSFHYGDGCFETMRLVNGKIPLWRFHKERLLKSLKALKMVFPSSFNTEALLDSIIQLTTKNKELASSRVRLTFFRGYGNLYQFNQPFQYLAESFPLQIKNQINEKGLNVDFYTGAIKHYDQFSFIKSTAYLPSAMATIYAKENGLDDVILLNEKGFAAETSVANIFIIKNGEIKTPSLQQGCISGVMRKYLIEYCKKDMFEIHEKSISKEDVLNADEVFTTNGVKGIEWVSQCDQTSYTNNISAYLYQKYIQPLWQ